MIRLKVLCHVHFVAPLGLMLTGSGLASVAARVATGNPFRGGAHGGVQLAGLLLFLAMVFGQTAGAVAWLCWTNNCSVSKAKFLIASVLSGFLVGAGLGVWSRFDRADYFHRPLTAAAAFREVTGWGINGLICGLGIGAFGIWAIKSGNDQPTNQQPD